MAFIVKTHESVEGTYRVEAESHKEAEAHFRTGHGPIINWDGVEQQDYMAFSCDVQSVVEESHE